MCSKTSNLTTEFAVALSCKPTFIQTRLVALGHYTVCGRCGGSGHYSYNAMTGTTCFGCNGSGKTAIKLTPALLQTVKQDVAEGKMQPYLDRLARKAKVKGFTKRLLEAHGRQPSMLKDEAEGKRHWSQQSQRVSEINHFCHPFHEEARTLTGQVENGIWDKATRKYIPLTDDALDVVLKRLDEIMDQVNRAEDLAPVREPM